MPRRPVATALLVLLLVGAGCVSVTTGPLDSGETRQATVTRVVDGDTVDVRFADGTTDTVRLLGVDAPETGGENEPGEYEDVPDTEAGRRCLASAGDAATGFAERHLDGASVSVVTDPVADRRGDYDRLLAYVELPDGTDLNYRLVATGHARVYDSTFSRSGSYYAAESDAQAGNRGLWACREPGSAAG
jgi:micrococcal nuclease